jgi:transposase
MSPTENTTVSTIVNAREQRGREIAKTLTLRKKGDCWVVPSQSGDDPYTVDLTGTIPHCTCPDHTIRRSKCKHIWAVEFTTTVESTTKEVTKPDGTTTVTKTVRVTYKQNWPAYNAAQTEEKTRFVALLSMLCRTIPQPSQDSGRPRLPLADMVFGAAFKVYTGFSSRRFTSDLHDAHRDGFIGTAPHFNSVSNYLADENLTPLLKSLITISSLPLKSVETVFAVDSTGFTTCRFIRWFDKKYGKEVDTHEWVKLHVITGVQTNIVTAADVSDWTANDSPYFAPLVNGTAAHFRIAEVPADKAYISHKNLETVIKAGGVPYIPFKTNVVEPTDDSIWARLYHFYAYNREQFLTHYHQRSNVETTVSMIKGKFGDALPGKSTTAQRNEALCKVLCHNLCVVIQSIHELGIEPTFEPLLGPTCTQSRAPAQKVAV